MKSGHMIHSKDKEFKSIFLNEIHPSWIEAIPNNILIKKLIKKSNVDKKLTKYIKQFIDLKTINLANQSATIKLIHSCDAPILNKIILKAGAAQFSKRFSRTISQQDVRTIKDSLGEDVYKFSLYEAPLSFPDIIKIENKNIQFTTNNPFINVVSAGYRSFKIALERIPNNCTYKLPKQWDKLYLNENSEMSIDNKERILHMELIFSLFDKHKEEIIINQE